MPTGNIETGRLYYDEINGNRKPVEMIYPEDFTDIFPNLDNVINNPEHFKGGEITFKMSRKECKRMKKILQSVCPRYFTNNWRKIHHLPLIRRRGKRK